MMKINGKERRTFQHFSDPEMLQRDNRTKKY